MHGNAFCSETVLNGFANDRVTFNLTGFVLKAIFKGQIVYYEI